MRVVLGVSGGIAAYKACSLLRLFTEHGHDVTVVPTAAALRFVGAPTWSALSGKPVSTEVWTSVHEVPHVRIGQSADLVVVAPGHGRPAGEGRTRPRRRPPDQHPAHRPVPGRLRAGHAHRDVGAPGHPGQRRDAALARCARHRPRRGPPHRQGHRRRPPPRARGAVCRVPRDRRGWRAAAPAEAPAAISRAGASSSPPAAPASRSTRCATSATARPASRAWPSPRGGRPRGEGHPRGRQRRAPGARGHRRRARRDDPRAAAAVEEAADGADVVVMAAAPADFRPASVSDSKIKKSDPDAGLTRRARREPRHRPRPGRGTRRPRWPGAAHRQLRGRDGRRAGQRHGPRPREVRPQGQRPAGRQRGRHRPDLRQGRDDRAPAAAAAATR